jgi:hypothetical protein
MPDTLRRWAAVKLTSSKIFARKSRKCFFGAIENMVPSGKLWVRLGVNEAKLCATQPQINSGARPLWNDPRRLFAGAICFALR